MIDIKIVKRDGFNKGDEKQELSVELTGLLVVYGQDAYENFRLDLERLVTQYAI